MIILTLQDSYKIYDNRYKSNKLEINIWTCQDSYNNKNYDNTNTSIRLKMYILTLQDPYKNKNYDNTK